MEWVRIAWLIFLAISPGKITGCVEQCECKRENPKDKGCFDVSQRIMTAVVKSGTEVLGNPKLKMLVLLRKGNSSTRGKFEGYHTIRTARLVDWIIGIPSDRPSCNKVDSPNCLRCSGSFFEIVDGSLQRCGESSGTPKNSGLFKYGVISTAVLVIIILVAIIGLRFLNKRKRKINAIPKDADEELSLDLITDYPKDAVQSLDSIEDDVENAPNMHLTSFFEDAQNQLDQIGN